MNKLHIEKIKSLREKISVSLKTASDLLTKNNGDILLCEKEFHDNNINEICKIAQCDEVIAKEYYLLFKFDVCKSIEKINQRQVIITTGKEDTNHKNKIGFILWPENSKGEFYKTDKL